MKFKHTDTSYYMHICGLQGFLYTIKMKKYARTVIKESSPKPFKMLKIILLRGASPPEPTTRALPWTHRGLGGPLDPSPKLVPPKGSMSGSGPDEMESLQDNLNTLRDLDNNGRMCFNHGTCQCVQRRIKNKGIGISAVKVIFCISNLGLKFKLGFKELMCIWLAETPV